jgi:GntR family transcriptional regulator
MITVERGGFMNLSVSMYSDKPIYEQLKEQIKKSIIQKEIKAGFQLPSVRTLSKDLQVGIVTVKRAYDDLVQEGYIISQAARGYYVLDVNITSVHNEYKQKIRNHIIEILRLADEAKLSISSIDKLWNERGE